MLRGDLRHTEAGAVRLRPVLVVVVVLGVLAAGLLVWRPGLVDDVRDAFTSSPAPPDPDDDPADVAPPAGLDLPAVPAPPPVAAPREPADTGVPDAAAVRRALAGPLRDRDLGGRVVVGVSGLATDRGDRPVLLGAPEAAVPASTTKVMTAAAALEALGPERRFATRVVDGGTRGGVAEVVLVGGGDPLLASAPDPDRPLGEPARADLRTLAEDTRRRCAPTGPGGCGSPGTTRCSTVRPRAPPGRTTTSPRASSRRSPPCGPTAGCAPTTCARPTRRARRPARSPPRCGRPAYGRRRAARGDRAHGGHGAGAGHRPAGGPAGRAPPRDERQRGRRGARPPGRPRGRRGGVLPRRVPRGHRHAARPRRGPRRVRLNDGSGLSRANRLTATALLDVLDLAAAPDRPELRSVLTACRSPASRGR